MNIIRMASILSSISCSVINSRLSLFTPKQSNPNPFIILSLCFHTSSPNYTTVYRSYKHGLEEIKNVDEAVDLFQEMVHTRPPPSAHDFSKLLKIVMKMKCYEHVVVMARSLSELGFPRNEFIMSIVVNCYCELREVGFGFAVVGTSLKCGFGVDVVSVNCIIKGLFLREEVGKAVDLFKRLIRFGLCEVSAFTISTVASGLCKSGNVVHAVELVELMERRKMELNMVVYNTLIDGLCKAGLMEDATRLMFKMIDKGVLPDVVTYTSFIHGLCNHKELRVARNMFNDLPSKMIYPNVLTYTVMIQGLCRAGLFEDAKEMVHEMEQRGCIPDSVTHNAIIQGCLRHPRSFSSINLFKQIVERDFQLNAGTFFLLLRQIKGNYKGVPIEFLVQKLLYSDPERLMKGIQDDVMIKSLIQKLTSSDDRTISY